MKKIPCNVGASRKAKPSSNCIVIVALHLKINYSYIIVLLFKSCMECNTLAILYVMLYQLLWCHSTTSLTTIHPICLWIDWNDSEENSKGSCENSSHVFQMPKNEWTHLQTAQESISWSSNLPITYGESSYGGQYDCKAKTSGKH